MTGCLGCSQGRSKAAMRKGCNLGRQQGEHGFMEQ